ncbi:MAG TPA: hypothetical protein VKA70_11915 [Blastocatellia bacterium]|nr:hypothetical protein [Blastocatellia bacterium]
MIRIFLAVVLISAVALTGCTGNGNSNQNANVAASSNTNKNYDFRPPETVKPTTAFDPNFKACNPYFPLVPGSQAKYTIVYSSGLVADANVVVDAAEENGRQVFTQTTQIVDKSGGLEKAETTVRKFICDGEKVQLIYEFTNNKVADRANTVETQFRTTAIMMPALADLSKTGYTWSYNFGQIYRQPGELPMSPDPMQLAFDVQGQFETPTPAGKFKTLKIRRKIGEAEVFEFFARGVGMVVRHSGEGTRWDLKEYSGLTPVD